MVASIEGEFFKLARRRTSWLSICALAVLPILLGLVVPSSAVQTAGPTGSEPPVFSGYVLLVMTMSTAMALFAPLVSAFIGAELLAKEIKDGTIKLSLMRPISRTEVLLSKCLASLVHNVVLVVTLWFVAVIVGGVLFHYGPLDSSMSASINIGSPGGGSSAINPVVVSGVMSQTEALLRLGASYAYLALSLTVVGLLALFLSTVITNQAGVVVATLGVIVGMRTLESVAGLKRYLLSSHLITGSLLSGEIDWRALWSSLGVLAAYAAVFILAAILIFRRKDIHT